MKAVVTGGAGFIGSHLVDALAASGAEVHVIDNLSAGSRARVHPSAALHVLDVRSPEARAAIAAAKPDVVFHLAAQADVQQSILSPDLDLSVNVQGTLNVLEACREARVRKLVFASTSGVYGDLERELTDEEDPAEPISYYGLSKLTAERYIRMYGGYHGLAFTILRYGNVFGPRQTAKGEGGVIALFMQRLKEGATLFINGDGEQTRDFVYVSDVVRANLAAAGSGDGLTLHVSTGRPTSINRLVERLRARSPVPVETVNRPARSGDILHSCLSNERARLALRWQPAVTFDEGLDATWRYWFE